MLNQYLKQCCLLIEAQDLGSSGNFTAIHRVTAEMDIAKKAVSANSEVCEAWKKLGYDTYLLQPNDSKLPWAEAFKTAFDEGYRKVILLTSVPDQFDKGILEEAFLSLRILEVCMGPSKNGNLYLCGFNQFRPDILNTLPADSQLTWKLFQKAVGSVKAAMYKTRLL